MGVDLDGEAVAYPIRILNWHEVVNDVVGGKPVVVTYCPLCGSGVVFDGRVGGKRVLFGVSGLLYNSDVLLYDRDTESLFSQLMMKAITGPYRGTGLEVLPAVATTWKAWRRRHPDTKILSPALPFGRDYGTDPYAGYQRSGTTLFPVKGADRSRGSKAWAWLVLAGEEKLLVAEDVLLESAARHEAARYRVGARVALEYDPKARELTAREDGVGDLTVISGYWFALTAFHPDARQLTSGDLPQPPTARPRGQ